MTRRLEVAIQGAVQGVGFRPFVHRLAHEEGLAGWVRNDETGVALAVEGPEAALERFLSRLRAEAPPHALVRSFTHAFRPAEGLSGFSIVASAGGGARSVAVLPDLAPCGDCLRELRDPADRRFRYPFLNCTACGPRFTIVRDLPYDRPRTTMAGFPMCAACRAEYEEPRDRRFHAQPTACPDCGPRLALWSPSGAPLARDEAALQGALEAIRGGGIVAVKGLGGFHLVCDATDGRAVARLREAKHRRARPFALMVRDLAAASALAEVGDAETALLASPRAPILLLRRRPGSALPPEVAPGSPRLGVMLPSTPLHHLLLEPFGTPLVATSGNRSDEPIAIDEREALVRLEGMADVFLVNDRPIERHADDGIAWVAGRSPAVLRRARGWAPLPVTVPGPLPPLLAVGAHLKCTVAIGRGDEAVLGQHLGDLETPEALAAFERVIADLLRLYRVEPVAVAHDLHPDYLSTQWARALVAGDPSGFNHPAALREAAAAGRVALVPVQHHHAHLAACLAENGWSGPALGVTWDGTGWGPDGTVWGGELLLGDAGGFRRAGHLRPFRLPGGEAAVREPRRCALALLHASGLPPGAAPLGLDHGEVALLSTLLARGVGSPVTTSAGRLFDGVAALVGLHPRAEFEGQAAMALEALAGELPAEPYPLAVREADGSLVLDWEPLLQALLEDLARGADRAVVAARFHEALAAAIEAAARLLAPPAVALSGGCFQNARLLERTTARLREAGFTVLLHREVPANDGGISLGQVAVAAARLAAGSPQA